MPKEHVRRSLERDAYLTRNEDKEASLQRLKSSVERLTKAMSLSLSAKDELLTYAETLLERRETNQEQANRLYEGNFQNNTQEKTPPVVGGAVTSD